MPQRSELPQGDLDFYRGYAGLPPLVGLHSMSEAVTTGLTVAECVARLLRMHWSLRRLHFIFVSRISAMPVYELKMALSLHGFYCAEHVDEFAARVREMRQPPYDLERSPDPNLDVFFDEVLSEPSVEAFTLGLYGYAVPALVRGMERLINETNRLFDHPTYRICRLTLVELNDVLEYGQQAVKCLVPQHALASLHAWTGLLSGLLDAAGDLDGTHWNVEPDPVLLAHDTTYEKTRADLKPVSA